jgi:proteic killer suppression protein
MDAEKELGALDRPGWRLHQLRGDRAGTWSIHVNGPWCITFVPTADGWEDLDYENYH